VWTEHAEFGWRLAKRIGTEWYNGGGKNPEDEHGDRPIVCSVKANNSGLNLQYAFHKMLFASSPSSGDLWEQCLGRVHRQGQRASEVTVWVCQHTAELRGSLLQARADAAWQQQFCDSPQKLCVATGPV
jgi:hypothetical protein